MEIDWFDSEKYFFTDESVKRQITVLISENLTDSDLESRMTGESYSIITEFTQFNSKSESVKIYWLSVKFH